MAQSLTRPTQATSPTPPFFTTSPSICLPRGCENKAPSYNTHTPNIYRQQEYDLLAPCINKPLTSATMDNTFTNADEYRKNFLASAAAGEGEERLANSHDKFADTTHTNNATRSSRRSVDSSDVRNLQKQLFELSKENEMLKEVLGRIHGKSAPKCSCSDGDAKIEEAMKDLKLEQQQLSKDVPQISPLSDSDDTSNEQVPRTIDISDRSGYNLDLRDTNDMENNTKEGKQKKFNYIATDDERAIDYFQLYS